MRLDMYLVRGGFVSSRQRAKETVRAGKVFVDGKQITKPGWMVPAGAAVEIRGKILAYPSRAGLKLEKALRVFEVDVEGLEVLDVGAGAGGFTSCLLKNGARIVYAADVGWGQLAEELRIDPRVVVFEKTDIRDLTLSALGGAVDLAAVDVSFISLEKVFPTLRQLLKPGGRVIALIKPQFETGGVGLNKHGVITDPRTHLKFIPPLIGSLQKMGFGLKNFTFSPITGNKGNLEYLAYFKISEAPAGAESDADPLVNKVIEAAWSTARE